MSVEAIVISRSYRVLRKDVVNHSVMITLVPKLLMKTMMTSRQIITMKSKDPPHFLPSTSRLEISQSSQAVKVMMGTAALEVALLVRTWIIVKVLEKPHLMHIQKKKSLLMDKCVRSASRASAVHSKYLWLYYAACQLWFLLSAWPSLEDRPDWLMINDLLVNQKKCRNNKAYKFVWEYLG